MQGHSSFHRRVQAGAAIRTVSSITAKIVSEGSATTTAEDLEPSFKDNWYPVALSEQLTSDAPFATRLWGEPIVLFRDAKSVPVCLRDVCPHRSAPLSMGDVQDGKLVCFYHGWGFGSQGACLDVPTARGSKNANFDSYCATSYAVAEHDGLLWVWRGVQLSADARKLPTYIEDNSYYVDTVLDYDCDWNDVLSNRLASSHMYWCDEAVAPAVFSLARALTNTSLASLRANKDDAAGAGAASKADADRAFGFTAPNVVRHRDRVGVAEEFFVVPIAPRRARAILRQRFPKDHFLAKTLQMPGVSALMKSMVRNWNYCTSFEDYADMQSALVGEQPASNERTRPFHEWRRRAEAAEQPYFKRWSDRGALSNGAQVADNQDAGTYGLKRNYMQDTPAVAHAPANSAPFKAVLAKYQAAAVAASTSALAVATAIVSFKSSVAAATAATTAATTTASFPTG